MAISLSKLMACVLALVVSFSSILFADGTIDTKYNESATISRWRSDRDFVTPVLMIKAATMSRSGYTKEQIIDNLTEHRAEYARHQAAGLRRDWEVDKDYKMLIRHGGALVGVGVEFATKEIFDASVVGQAISDFGVFSYESLIRNSKVRSASRALGLNYKDINQAEDSIASYVSDTFGDNELFREVYAEQFAATMGFAPNDDVETVNQAFPEFGSNENVKAVLNILRDESGVVKVSLSETEKAELADAWAESLNSLREDNASRLDEISQTDSASLDLLRKIEMQENEPRALELSRAKDRVRMEGLRSGAYLAGTAIGLIDEELGRQFNAVTTAAFEINRSIEAFSAATKLGEDLTGSASMIMTGDFVGVALSLVGAFGSSGPSADELILEQLAKIREEIAQVRQEMHERFDIVDKKLDAIYERMDDGFVSLESELRRTTNRSLLSIQRALQDIQASHYTALSIDIDQTDLQIAYLKAFELNPCLGRKSKTSEPFDRNQFANCSLKIQGIFSPEVLSKNQLSVAQANDGTLVRQMLLEQQNKATLISFAAFAEASDKAFLFDTIIGPTDWTFAANAYLDFLLEWPEHKDVVTDADFEVLALEGQKIADFSAAVHRDFTAFSEHNESSAVGKVLNSSKTETVAALNTLVDFYESEFFSDELKRTKVNIRGELSSVVPKQAEISPITDAAVRDDICRFHNSDYIGQAPVGIANLIPLYLRQAMELGIGRVEYCLQFQYNQPRYLRNMNPNGATEYETIINGPGPYNVSLKATFVHSSLNCAPHVPKMKGRAQFLHLALEDKTKMAGRSRVRAPIPEKSIWEGEWRKKFVSTIEKGGPYVTAYPTWKVYTDCLEKTIKPLTQTQFNSLKALGSDYIARKVATDDNLAAQDVTNLERYAQISHWAWTAYSDRALRSDLLRSIVSGGISGPNMSEIILAVNVKDKFAWHMPSIFEAELDRYSDALKSEVFKGSIQGYAGNFGVEDILDRIPQ